MSSDEMRLNAGCGSPTRCCTLLPAKGHHPIQFHPKPIPCCAKNSAHNLRRKKEKSLMRKPSSLNAMSKK
uniref:RE66017p n=1 Tax=Drosophila melanogaster TaxID=7227 RepID=Q8IGM2_DROME|nr:RE66017p [Drosophila melanogaster]